MSGDLTLPGWTIGSPDLRVVGNRYATDFGDPTVSNSTYSRVVIDVPVSRPRVTYSLKLLLYGFVVLTLAVIVRNSWVEARGDIASAVRADRQGLALLSVLYVVAAAAVLAFSLT